MSSVKQIANGRILLPQITVPGTNGEKPEESGRGWEQARNILCVRLDTLGDILMTTPAIRALKQAHPARRITLLTSAVGAEVAALVPEIDEILVYDAPWTKATSPRSNSRREYEMAERLRQGDFDAAVIFTVYSQNPLPAAFLCYLADIPLRLAHCHENPYQLLTNWVPDPEPEETIRHEVRRQLDLVAAVGCRTDEEGMSLGVPPCAPEEVRRLLEDCGIDLERPWLVIHPGVTASSRQYPAVRYAEAARQLVRKHDFQVVFTGSRSEEELIDSIRRGMDAHSVSLANCLDLGQLAALLQMAPLLIANNTGPVHMAAALGTPVVDLYALTNPQHTPWAVPNRVLFHDVPCKFCYKSVCPEGHHHCLWKVTAEEVVNAVCELWQESCAPLQEERLHDSSLLHLASLGGSMNNTAWR